MKSRKPPVEIVRRYPGVTLMVADENSGPYRLVQQVINDTDYDAYLFQDADDWSSPDRLEKLLGHAEAIAADMIGSQEVRVFCDEPEAVPVHWPLDGNQQFKERATVFPLLHPPTLVSRAALIVCSRWLATFESTAATPVMSMTTAFARWARTACSSWGWAFPAPCGMISAWTLWSRRCTTH